MLRKLGLVSSSVALASLAALALPGSTAVGTSAPSAVPMIEVGPVIKSVSASPPSAAFCETNYDIACYGPSQMAAEYNYGPAYKAGDNGKGQTIVIFDSYGSPTIRNDLAHFDTAYNLPAPPALNIYHPEGNVVLNYDKLPSPANYHSKQLQTEVSWAYETTLDVEYSHAMAPGATIDLVTVPVNETEGVQGLENLERAQAWALANIHANIWSNSWSTTEQSFHNSAVIERLNKLYAEAAADGVSVFFAAGDSGVANTNKQGVTYPYPTVNFPTSSPNVIAVGGTQIGSEPTSITSHVTEQVWNDGYGAGGGGYSSVFPEPSSQLGAGISDPTQMRGLPDVSYNAAVISSVLIYESFDPVNGPGWVPIGGTSAATPQWAAVDADVQSSLGSQGFLAPKLYQIYQSPSLYAEAFYPVLSGNNSFDGITGYSAAAGWNAASGLGTPNVSGLIAALRTLS